MTKEEKRLAWEAKKEAQRFAKYGPKKKSAFTNLLLKTSLNNLVDAEALTILKPRMRYIRSVAKSIESSKLAELVEDYLNLSNRITCKMKPTYSMEEAAMSQQIQNEKITPYICRSCGFVHFGHVPMVLNILQTVQIKQVAA